MPGKGTRNRGPGARGMNAIRGKVPAVVALLTGVVTVASVMVELPGWFQKAVDFVRPSGLVASKDCFDVTLDVRPTTVSVAKWNAVRFDLVGHNECNETLAVHVAFKSLSSTMRIEPFRGFEQAACRIDDSDCWERRTLDRGKPVKWQLTAPRLTQLGPLLDPEPLGVNWVVYNTDTKKHLRAGLTQITVQRDAGP